MLLQLFFQAVEPFCSDYILFTHENFSRMRIIAQEYHVFIQTQWSPKLWATSLFFTPLTPVVNVGTHGHPTLTLGKGVKNDGIIYLCQPLCSDKNLIFLVSIIA